MTLSSSFQTVMRRLAGTAVAAIALSATLAFAAPRGAALAARTNALANPSAVERAMAAETDALPSLGLSGGQ